MGRASAIKSARRHSQFVIPYLRLLRLNSLPQVPTPDDRNTDVDGEGTGLAKVSDVPSSPDRRWRANGCCT